MRKSIHDIPIKYTFDPDHKNAHYTLDGVHFMNGGDLAEVVTKAIYGYKPVKDASTRYDLASDIEELNASVKSSKFTLVNTKLADTFEATIDRYFETVHSTRWIYTVIIDDTATLYEMNKEEFKEFLYTFTGLNERKLIRCKATSGKMIGWFEERVGR